MAGGDSGTTMPFEKLLAQSAQDNVVLLSLGRISYGNNLEECYLAGIPGFPLMRNI